jgi:hypothetical protein
VYGVRPSTDEDLAGDDPYAAVEEEANEAHAEDVASTPCEGETTPIAEASSIQPVAAPPTRRRPGRPRGSKNRPKPEAMTKPKKRRRG